MTGLRLAAALAAFLSTVVPAVAQAPGAGGPPPPPTVTVVTVAMQDVTLTSTLPGRVVASGVAEVRPQIDGIITKRLFEEGASVALGDPLYQIAPESYEAAVAAAKARVTQARAQLLAAERQAERIQSLTERSVVTEQTTDNAIAARDGAAAALEIALADLQAAEIDLARTTIRAPLSGIIGRSTVTQGALVRNGQTDPLAVIRALDPVNVDVTQSAAELIAFRRGITAEKLKGGDTKVTLFLPDGQPYERTGEVTAAEPQVDERTGVVILRLSFPNPDRLLLPGMYVQVEMPQTVLQGVALVPQRGVGRNRRGEPTALVVGADGTVEERVLDVVRSQGGNWIVRGGLSAGDKVIVEGVQKTRPGGKVVPEEAPAGGAAPEPGKS